VKIAAFYENIVDGACASHISLHEAMAELKKQGMELLYISIFSLREKENQIVSLLKDLELGLEGIYGFYDFAHFPEDDSWKEIIDSAKRLGASNVLIVPGMIPKEEQNRKDILIHNMKTAMTRAVHYGQELEIAVSMEDFDGMEAPYCTITGLDGFLKDIPGLTCSFDTGNFIMYQEDELEAFRLFRDKICTVHLKDRRKEAKYTDDRAKICADGSLSYAAETGKGYIQIKEILDLLKEQNYPGNVIVELYDYSPKHMLEGISESISWVAGELRNIIK